MSKLEVVKIAVAAKLRIPAFLHKIQNPALCLANMNDVFLYIFFLKNIITEIYIPSFMPRNRCIFYIHLSICSTTVDMLLCRFICQMFVRRSYLLLGFVLRIVYECFCWFWNNPRASYQITDPICNHLLLLLLLLVVVMMQMMEYMMPKMLLPWQG